MSDIVWQAILATIATVVIAYFQYKTAASAARKVDEVKSTLHETTAAATKQLTRIGDVTDQVHGIVNSKNDALMAEIAKLKEEITGLKTIISQQR